MMKVARIVSMLMSLVLCTNMFAQRASDKDRELTFVYIAHDVNTPVQTLCDRLQLLYNDALDYPESRAVIFYMANEDYPIICRVNTARQNRSAFREIMSELQGKRSHDNDPKTDIKKIQQIFSETDCIDARGEGTFKSLNWYWYINSTYVELGYHQSIIAPIFEIFDMRQMLKDGYLTLNMFYGEDDSLPVAEGAPFFGEKYSNITLKDCSLLPY